jgi:hypothetical protein
MNTMTQEQVRCFVQWADNNIDIRHDVAIFFKRQFLKETRWGVLIYEQDFKYDAPKLSKACERFSFTKATSFSFGGSCDFSAIEVGLNNQDLIMLHEKYFAPSYILIEHGKKFSLLSDSDYFWAVAGPKEFLDDICDRDPHSVLDKFREGIDPYIKSNRDDMRSIGNLLKSYCAVAVESWS